MKPKQVQQVAIVLVVLISILNSSHVIAQELLQNKLERIASSSKSGATIGISVVNISQQKNVFGFNASKALKPASVLKILTSLVALKKLGPEFRFHTDLLIDRQDGDYVPNLYVRGNGDTHLTTENLWIMVRKLKKLGISRIGKVNFDNGAFLSKKIRQGQRAYDSSSAAISFNFNSIAIEICPARSGQPAFITPDPWDSEVEISGSVLTVNKVVRDISVDEVPKKSPSAMMAFQLSGQIEALQACKTVYRSVEDPLEYFAASFIKFAALSGIKVQSSAVGIETPPDTRLIFENFSKSLALIIQDLNHFSTNFIGEQILYNLGVDDSGRFYDRNKGIEVLSSFISKLGFEDKEFLIADGSGLSHENRLSARILTILLNMAVRNEEIRPEFENSLSVAGRNGTLKKRGQFSDGLVLRGKTGTLNDVSSLAGYVVSKNGSRYAFAIIQNGIKSREQALTTENLIVEAIYNG